MNGFHVILLFFLVTPAASGTKRFVVGTATQYRVTVATGDKSLAGTTAHVYVSMTGEHGVTGELQLPSSNANFQRGRVDQFHISAPSVGKLTSIHVRHDNHGGFAGWYLEKITIEDSDGVYEFQCNCWLSNQAHKLSTTIILTKYSPASS